MCPIWRLFLSLSLSVSLAPSWTIRPSFQLYPPFSPVCVRACVCMGGVGGLSLTGLLIGLRFFVNVSSQGSRNWYRY